MEDRESKRRKVSTDVETEDEDRTDMADIAKIPEVLTYILSFVQPRFPHLLRLSLVCKLWHNLIAQPSALWGGSLTFYGGGSSSITSAVIQRYLSRCPRNLLTSFFLDCIHDLSKLAVHEFIPLLTERAENMTRLVLGIPFIGTSMPSVIQLARQCRRLKELTLVYGGDETFQGNSPLGPTSSDLGAVRRELYPNREPDWFDVVANLPSDLSGVSLTLEPKPSHRSICQHSAIWMRTPHKGITSLTINYDETVSQEELSMLGRFLPSLESFAVHSSWRPFPLESLSECLPNLKSFGFGSSELYRENDILTLKTAVPNLRELIIFQGHPTWAHLGQLTQLESLSLHDVPWGIEDEDVDAMFYSLSNLRRLEVPCWFLGKNPSHYILTKCSLQLEVLRIDDVMDPKHIRHLLEGTFDEDLKEASNKKLEADSAEEEDEEDSAGDKDWKEIRKRWKEEKKTGRRKHPGLKSVEIVYESQPDYYPHNRFVASKWQEWYVKAIEFVREKGGSVRMVNAEPYLSAFFVKED